MAFPPGLGAGVDVGVDVIAHGADLGESEAGGRRDSERLPEEAHDQARRRCDLGSPMKRTVPAPNPMCDRSPAVTPP